MGWLNDWFDKDSIAGTKLPSPTRPAHPMPECKPPNPDLNISEPVIKLLAMLDEDVWEPVTDIAGHTGPFKFQHPFELKHIYKEDYSVWACEEVWGYPYNNTPSKFYVEDCDWMTPDEARAIFTKVKETLIRVANLNKQSSYEAKRESYKQYLETV